MRAAVSRSLASTIPLATAADVSQIERVRPMVHGRRVAIVGSAPMAERIAAIEPDEILIPVNGGISSTSGSVSIWVVGSKLSDVPKSPSPVKPLHSAMLAQCGGRHVGHVLLLRGPKVATEHATLAILDTFCCTYDSWSVLDKPTKRWLEGELCARRHDDQPCSSGILAAAIACYCRAERVRLIGFSFKPGYHYLPKDRPQSWWRNHIEADHRALGELARAYNLEGDIFGEVKVRRLAR